MDSARSALRQALQADHDRVDEAYGGFDLADPAAYLRFLTAHARALFAVETALADRAVWPAWRPRSALLRDDLGALGGAAPAAYADPLPQGAAASWAMLYVLEGSRLGGRVLSARVPAGLPKRYLDAVHQPGEWKLFTTLLGERFAELSIEQWQEAEQAARIVFALFARSAAEETGSLGG